MILTTRAALVALALLPVAAAVPSRAAWLGLLVTLLVVVAVDALLAGSPRSLQMVRGGAVRTRMGQPVDVHLEVSSRARRRVRATLRDGWPPSSGQQPTRHTLDLRPGGRTSLTTTLVPTRRGTRRPDRVTVRSVGPLGLAGRQSAHRVPWQVQVLPAFTSHRELPSRLRQLQEIEGRTSVLIRGAGTEFDSLRPYVEGDDVRAIDWRATARSTDVMVRTWRPERDRRVVIVLDTGRTSAGRVENSTRLDAGMEGALLLAAVAARAGDRVSFLAHDTQLRAAVSGSAGGDPLPAMMMAMSGLEPALVETDARAVVGTVLGRFPQRALVVLITPMEPAALSSGLLPMLPTLVARHQVLLASVDDPTLTTMSAGHGDVDSVYAAASARKAVADRERVAGTLRRMGALTVGAPPDRFAGGVADTYLALKARGRV